LHLARPHRIQREMAALVRHMHDIRAGDLLEKLGGRIRKRADAA